jgi:hypothetical protein
MKGGITSGIVYPNAVLALAKDFRFKNIGGTSAGAIAAAASAAAALGDRKIASGQASADAALGFAGLEQVAEALSTEGFIYDLFQPARGATRAYRTIIVLAGNASALRKVVTVLFGIVAMAPIEFVLLLAGFLALGFWATGSIEGVFAALAPALVCAYLGAAIFALLRVARVARRNLLGLCLGMRQPVSWLDLKVRSAWRRPAKPALTEWLHEVLQSLAGKALDDPLTFDDLWSAPRYSGEPATPTAIKLQMITTSVSHHEPRTLPFTQDTLWFQTEEMELLFPKSLVDWMVTNSTWVEDKFHKRFYKLPSNGRMPVLVAMRMSLSFPLLISAVPLHEPETRRKSAAEPSSATKPVQTGSSVNFEEQSGVASHTAAGETIGSPGSTPLTQSMDGLVESASIPASSRGDIETFRICWFSDGGISSNFPLHLFDGPLPLWPTFAINLVYPKTDDRPPHVLGNTRAFEAVEDPHIEKAAKVGEEPDKAREIAEAAVYLPVHNNVGWQRSYQAIAKGLALSELGGFLFGIVGTMQNWRDQLQARAPGHRDRIVHVSLNSQEGGINLNMSQDVLTGISLKGTVAGERLYEFSFDNHYWIRWRNVASAVQRYTIAIARADQCAPKIPGYMNAFATAKTGVPASVSYTFQSASAKSGAEALLANLVMRGAEWDDLGPDLSKGAPQPEPQMQIVPIY